MGTRYQQLKSEQRNQIQRGLNEGLIMRAVAKQIGRSPRTVSRKVRRGLVGETYDAIQDREEAQRRRRKGGRKLVEGGALNQRGDTRYPAKEMVTRAGGREVADGLS